MKNKSDSKSAGVSNWRFRIGVAIFILSIVMPLLGIPAVTASSLSVAMKSTLSGVLLVGAEVTGVIAIAVMGKPGYTIIKRKVFTFLNRHGPPREVGRVRYKIGLFMFWTPLLFGWVAVYISDYIPGYSLNPLPYAIGGDLLLLTSFFVLGGGFWDKIGALFICDAKVQFSQ